MARGRKNLIDTRKRKLSSIDKSDSDITTDSVDPLVKMERPRADLGAMLKPTNIPRDKYFAIQGVLIDQDRAITKSKNEVKRQCTQIRELEADLAGAQARIDRDSGRLDKKDKQIADAKAQLGKSTKQMNETSRELRGRKKYFDSFSDDQNQMIDLGRKVLAEKTERAERLRKENQHF